MPSLNRLHPSQRFRYANTIICAPVKCQNIYRSRFRISDESILKYILNLAIIHQTNIDWRKKTTKTTSQPIKPMKTSIRPGISNINVTKFTKWHYYYFRFVFTMDYCYIRFERAKRAVGSWLAGVVGCLAGLGCVLRLLCCGCFVLWIGIIISNWHLCDLFVFICVFYCVNAWMNGFFTVFFSF